MKPPILVHCERIDNESFCEALIHELGAHYEVRPFGPGWPEKALAQVNQDRVRFYLELDPASGNFDRPAGLADLHVPKFAWLVDTHKKMGFHQLIAKDMDLTFHAAKNWGHVLPGERVWLPLHFDERIFKPVECERDLDVVFVGSYPWRADAIRSIAARHGLKIEIVCTTGPREKTETAALYARAKLVFNRHITNDLNFRVFEAMGCGRVLLTDAQPNGQYELFEDGKHYVLYKDDADLERQIVRYLGDGPTRKRIEREAALVSRFHSTRARASQLHDLIEAFLARRISEQPPVSRPRSPRAAGGEVRASGAAPKQKWLFFAGSEPETMKGRTYAEQLAWGLAGRGHEVVIVRERRCALPIREPREKGVPRVIELDREPLPRASTEGNELLEVSGPFHAEFERVFWEHGPFDVLVGEGALGALIAAPVAERHGTPFFMALDDCEVGKRENRLTREQLALAELENWGVDRAKVVLLPRTSALDSVRRHYNAATRARLIEPPAPPNWFFWDAERLLPSLGLDPRGYLAVLAPRMSEDEKARLFAGDTSRQVLLLSDDVRVRRSDGRVEVLSTKPAVQAVLDELASNAEATVALDPRDGRVPETAHGPGVAILPREAPRDLATIVAVASQAKQQDRNPDLDARRLEELEDLVPARRPREEPAHVL